MYAFRLNQWAIARQEICANILKRIYLMIVDVAFSMNLFHIAYIWYLYLNWHRSPVCLLISSFHGVFNITNNLYTTSMFLWFSHNIKYSRGYHFMRKEESRSKNTRTSLPLCLAHPHIAHPKSARNLFPKTNQFHSCRISTFSASGYSEEWDTIWLI